MLVFRKILTELGKITVFYAVVFTALMLIPEIKLFMFQFFKTLKNSLKLFTRNNAETVPFHKISTQGN